MAVPSVGGVAIATPDEMASLDAAALRQRACGELLRQAAIAAGLLDADDPPPGADSPGVMTEAASAAVEALLDRELRVPPPADADCRRWHAANAARFAVGERVLARHVLFAVTPGVDIDGLRRRAEACLLDLRCNAAERFETVAREQSNCPSGAEGGQLGWLGADDCAPEFARELFARGVDAVAGEVGVLPRLVHSRFGLHVVEVLAREPGRVPGYEEVRTAVAQTLQRQAWGTALRQYLQLLAGRSVLVGVDLEAAATPLVQ